jgi:glutamate racemase
LSPSPCIGVFDSGLGGLSVLAALRAALPGVALHYIADSANAPYGEREPGFVIDRSLALTQQLVDAGAALVVIACNTATALAAAAVREAFPGLPVVGIEPGVKPAAQASRNGRVGVLATRGTLDSERFARLIAHHGGQTQFTLVACDGVAAAIEEGELDSPRLRELVARYSQPLRAAGVDVALLGCTHYPLIRPLWEAALPGVQLLQVEPAVAAQAARLWPAGLRTDGTLHLSSTGDTEVLHRLAR